MPPAIACSGSLSQLLFLDCELTMVPLRGPITDANAKPLQFALGTGCQVEFTGSPATLEQEHPDQHVVLVKVVHG
jgi:hypothetical protein